MKKIIYQKDRTTIFIHLNDIEYLYPMATAYLVQFVPDTFTDSYEYERSLLNMPEDVSNYSALTVTVGPGVYSWLGDPRWTVRGMNVFVAERCDLLSSAEII